LGDACLRAALCCAELKRLQGCRKYASMDEDRDGKSVCASAPRSARRQAL
jgi:hypothetical protein